MSSRSRCSDASILIPALNEGGHLRLTIESVRATVPADTEVIVVDDGSTDGCADFMRRPDAVARLLEPDTPGERLGAAAARNKAAAQAHGEWLVFLDAHVQLPRDWLLPLLEMLDNPAVGAAAPAISVWGQDQQRGYGLRWTDAALGVEWLPCKGNEPYAVPLLPGACLAIRRDVFLAAGGFDRGLMQWGSEDAELSLRLWRLGYELGLVPRVAVAHLFRERHPYAVAITSVVHNLLRVAALHFTGPRAERVDRAMRHHARYGEAFRMLGESDVAYSRQFMRTYAVRNDESYFSRFGDIN